MGAPHVRRGLPLIAVVFFAAASMMVVIPSTIQVFAWTLTVTMGRPLFKAPLMFIGGFIVFFVSAASPGSVRGDADRPGD